MSGCTDNVTWHMSDVNSDVNWTVMCGNSYSFHTDTNNGLSTNWNKVTCKCCLVHRKGDVMSHHEVLAEDTMRSRNSADEMLDQAAESTTTNDSQTPALMAIAYALLACKGELERIADILEQAE
jgi:hypothetical protein